jgi:hypothetical protein
MSKTFRERTKRYDHWELTVNFYLVVNGWLKISGVRWCIIYIYIRIYQYKQNKIFAWKPPPRHGANDGVCTTHSDLRLDQTHVDDQDAYGSRDNALKCDETTINQFKNGLLWRDVAYSERPWRTDGFDRKCTFLCNCSSIHVSIIMLTVCCCVGGAHERLKEPYASSSWGAEVGTYWPTLRIHFHHKKRIFDSMHASPRPL